MSPPYNDLTHPPAAELRSNAIELEQREGRVHRYKGHAVRKNVAAKHGAAVLGGGFCDRINRGEGVECQFFHERRKYLFLGDYKYWIMVECSYPPTNSYTTTLSTSISSRSTPRTSPAATSRI